MGYHDNERTTRKAVADACRFINDRERLGFALRLTLSTAGIQGVQQDRIINDVRACQFDSLRKALKIKAIDV